MRIRVNFTRDGPWWVAWTDEVPGAITAGATRGEARGRLIQAVQEAWRMRSAVEPPEAAEGRILTEEFEV